jgi:hypothetical protein
MDSERESQISQDQVMPREAPVMNRGLDHFWTQEINPMTTTNKFDLGQIVATPALLAKMQETGDRPAEFLIRHQTCDWGTVCPADKRANDAALTDGSRVLSAYQLRDGTKFWIITTAVGDDGKRESTCLLLPEEY